MLLVIGERKISHCISDWVIRMFLDVKGSIRQRMCLGVIKIVYRCVNTADGTVENGLVTVHNSAFVA